MVVKLLTDLIKFTLEIAIQYLCVKKFNSDFQILSHLELVTIFSTLHHSCSWLLSSSRFGVCLFFLLSYRAKLISFPSRLHSRQKSQNTLVQPLKKTHKGWKPLWITDKGPKTVSARAPRKPSIKR